MPERLGPGLDLERTIEVLRKDGVTMDIDGVDSDIGHLSIEDAERIAQKGATVVLVPQPWDLDYEPTHSNIIKVKGYPFRFRMVRAFLALAALITSTD